MSSLTIEKKVSNGNGNGNGNGSFKLALIALGVLTTLLSSLAFYVLRNQDDRIRDNSSHLDYVAEQSSQHGAQISAIRDHNESEDARLTNIERKLDVLIQRMPNNQRRSVLEGY